jgi:hypothetical protein
MWVGSSKVTRRKFSRDVVPVGVSLRPDQARFLDFGPLGYRIFDQFGEVEREPIWRREHRREDIIFQERWYDWLTMCVMHKETIISLADLRYVSISCPRCRASVTLDMQEESEFAKKSGISSPRECPSCRTPYDSAIPNNVEGMGRAYRSLLAIAERISFRGEPEISAI